MDRRQLITIAVTAATSVIAKEIITWVVAYAKSTAQAATTKAKARTLLSRRNLKTLGLFIFFAIFVWDLWFRMHETTPITRQTIFFIMVASFDAFIAVIFLGVNIMLRVDSWRDHRRSTELQSGIPASVPSQSAPVDAGE